MSRKELAMALGFVFLSAPVQAQVFERPEPAAGFSYEDYYCTNRGVRVEVDDVTCLTVGGKSFEAKCVVSINNPIWRATGGKCEAGATPEHHAIIAK